jgi:hypothetical protein
MPALPGARCCDNCTPGEFPVDTLRITALGGLKKGRRKQSSEELYDATHNQLAQLARDIVIRDYPNQHFLTGRNILDGTTIDALAKYAGSIDCVDDINLYVRWHWSSTYGEDVVKILHDVRLNLGEQEESSDESSDEEDVRERLVAVFNACILAVESSYDGTRRRCTLFQRLPSSRVRGKLLFLLWPADRVDQTYPDYRVLIENPVAIAGLRARAKTDLYQTCADFAQDWHLMFKNCRTYNHEDSQIYEDSIILQNVFDQELRTQSAEQGLSWGTKLYNIHFLTTNELA